MRFGEKQDIESRPRMAREPESQQQRTEISLLLLLRYILLAAIIIIVVSIYDGPAPHESPSPCDAVASDVLKDVPLIDGHNDFPLAIRFILRNHIYGSNFTNETELMGQVDFPRLREGRLGAQFWSVYIGCPKSSEALDVSKEDDFPDKLYEGIVHETLQQIDLVQRLTGAFPENLIAARSSKDVAQNYKQHPLRISSLMGAEGLHQIANSPSVLRLYHLLGVRYVTLTHFCHNKYADSASQPPYWHGISDDGRALITEMNRIGMAVDLAHTSADTMRQTLDHTNVPVIFSHASAYGVCSHPRNVPDDVLFKLKRNNGVIMITFVPDYVNCEDPKNASLSDVADHIEYVGKLIGYQHVGIGSDFDGMPSAPIGLEDVSKYPDLLKELASRGMTSGELKGVAGANVLRVLHDIEQATLSMGDVPPLEDDVPPLRFPEQADAMSADTYSQSFL